MNVPALPALNDRQDWKNYKGQQLKLDMLKQSQYPSNPSPLSPYSSQHTISTPSLTSTLDLENLLLESSRTSNHAQSARSTVSLMSQESRDNQPAQSNRAPSPISVLHELRGSLKHEPVLTNRGISDLSNNDYRQTGAESQLNDIIGSLLCALQQQQNVNVAQYGQNQYGSFGGIPVEMQAGYLGPVTAFCVNNTAQPTPQSMDLMQQILTNPSGNHLYKTEICRAYDETGKCRFGERCKYAHGSQELRTLARGSNYKTKICQGYVEEGYCPYGSRCNFIHKPFKLEMQVNNIGTSTPSSPSPTARSSSNCRLPIFQQLTEFGSME